MEKEFGNTFPAAALADLSRYEAVIKLLQDGTNGEAFRARMLPPLENRVGRKDKIVPFRCVPCVPWLNSPLRNRNPPGNASGSPREDIEPRNAEHTEENTQVSFPFSGCRVVDPRGAISPQCSFQFGIRVHNSDLPPAFRAERRRRAGGLEPPAGGDCLLEFCIAQTPSWRHIPTGIIDEREPVQRPNMKAQPSSSKSKARKPASAQPAAEAVAAPAVKASVAAPAVKASVAAPAVKASVAAPAVKASVAAPAVKASVAAPAVKASVAAPAVKASVAAPAVKASVAAPAVKASVPAPAVKASVAAPAVKASVAAPAVKASVAAPAVKASVAAPAVKASVAAPAVKAGKKPAASVLPEAAAEPVAKPAAKAAAPAPAAKTAAPKRAAKVAKKPAASVLPEAAAEPVAKPAAKAAAPAPAAKTPAPKRAAKAGKKPAAGVLPEAPAKPAAKAKARPALAIPPVLLETDDTPEPAASGPGERYALGGTPPAEPGESEPLKALPEAYGTQRLSLTARDPHWLYASWDFTREQLRHFNSLSLSGRLTLKVFRNDRQDHPFTEVELHPESRFWFVHVSNGGARYVAHLGYYGAQKEWKVISVSGQAVTPQSGLAEAKIVQLKTIVPPSLPAPPPAARTTGKPPAVASASQPAAAPLALFNPPPPAPLPPSEGPLTPAAPTHTPLPAPAGDAPAPAAQKAPQADPSPGYPAAIAPAPSAARDAQTLAPAPAAERPPASKAATASAAQAAAWMAAAPESVPSPVRAMSGQAGQSGQRRAPEAGRPVLEISPARQAALARWMNMDEITRGLAGSMEIIQLLQGKSAPGLPGAPVPQAGPVSSAGGGFGPARPERDFWLNVNAELVVYGATEPGSHLTLAGRRLALRPDGSFSVRFALPDGAYELTVKAVSADGQDARAAELQFSRSTSYHGAQDAPEWNPELERPPG